MDLRTLFQRLFNEQKWREQQAMKMGIPAPGSNQQLTDATPLTLEQRFSMDPKTQMLKHYMDMDQQKDQQIQPLIDNFEKELGPMPQWFWDRYKQKEWAETRQKGLANLHKMM